MAPKPSVITLMGRILKEQIRGTNDCTPIRFCPDFALVDGMEAHFHKKYKDFISYVRRCNGPDTYIACTLGSMVIVP